MTIAKSILITICIIISLSILGFSFTLIDDQSKSYQNILGLFFIIPNLVIYSIVLIYLNKSRRNFSFCKNIIKLKQGNLIFIIFLLVLGSQLFNMPIFDWKILASKFLGKLIFIENYTDQKFNLLLLYKMLNVIIVAPLFEEYIFRYYIFGGLLKKYSFSVSLFTSSFLYSLIHLLTPINLFPTFVLGIASAVIYYGTKQIRYSILFHLLYNVFRFFIFVFGEEYGKVKNNIGFGALYWFLFFCGGLLLFFGLNKITLKKRDS